MKLFRLAPTASMLALITAAACTTPVMSGDPASLVEAASREARAIAIVSELVVAPASAEVFAARCGSAVALINEMVAELETCSTPAGAADLVYLDTLSAVGWSVGNGEAGIVSEANPDPVIR